MASSPQAPPPPPLPPAPPLIQAARLMLPMRGQRAAPAAAVANLNWLERPINDVCNAGLGLLPYCAFSLPNPPWPGGRAALHGPAGPNGPPAVGALMGERLMTVLAHRNKANRGGFNAALGAMTIRDFRAAAPVARLAFIDALWNAVAAPRPFNRPAQTMDDPAYAELEEGDHRPFPTSWCPANAGVAMVRPGAAMPRPACRKRVAGQPWRSVTIGFRVDGSSDRDIERIRGNGMTQLSLDPAITKGPGHGLVLTGTVANDYATARYWTDQNDIFNETAVCVSRNLFGATAFPLRETNHRGAEFSLLWAVKCAGLSGCDTEHEQVGVAGSRWWRPGEKAFQAIPAANVLGWIKIRRRGAPAAGGWRFEIEKDMNWTFIPAAQPTVAQRVYMENELAAWRGLHEIPASWDFAT